MGEDQIELLKEYLNQRFDAVERRLTLIEQNMATLSGKFDAMVERIVKMELANTINSTELEKDLVTAKADISASQKAALEKCQADRKVDVQTQITQASLNTTLSLKLWVMTSIVAALVSMGAFISHLIFGK